MAPAADRPHITHSAASDHAAKEPKKCKRKPRRKPGEPPRPFGRPRGDGAPPVQRKAPAERAEKDSEPPYPATLEEFRARIFDLSRKGLARIHIAALVGVDAEDLKEGQEDGPTLEELFEKAQSRREDVNAVVRKAEAFGVEQICTAFHERATATTGHPLPGIAALNNRNGMKVDRAAMASKGQDGPDGIEVELVDGPQQDGAEAPGAAGAPREGAEAAAAEEAETST